jgi:hypothetical protein
LVELEELHEGMAGVVNEHAVEAMQLSWSVMEIFVGLVDLGVFTTRDIPVHPRSAQDLLTVASLVLERLREEHASGAGPWVRNLARLMSLQPQAIPPAVFFVLLACM